MAVKKESAFTTIKEDAKFLARSPSPGVLSTWTPVLARYLKGVPLHLSIDGI